jgi:hypothetical protein
MDETVLVNHDLRGWDHSNDGLLLVVRLGIQRMVAVGDAGINLVRALDQGSGRWRLSREVRAHRIEILILFADFPAFEEQADDENKDEHFSHGQTPG